MIHVNCPKCGSRASLVDSLGFVWRCYNGSAHYGEYSFVVDQATAEKAGAESRSLSASNAQMLREKST